MTAFGKYSLSDTSESGLPVTRTFPGGGNILRKVKETQPWMIVNQFAQEGTTVLGSTTNTIWDYISISALYILVLALRIRFRTAPASVHCI